MSDSDKMKEGKIGADLNFQKKKRRKKGCPIRPAFSEAEKEDVTCAAGVARLKNITYLVVRIGHYQRNMD